MTATPLCPKCGFPAHATATHIVCDRCKLTVTVAHMEEQEKIASGEILQRRGGWKCESCGSTGNPSATMCTRCGRWIASCCNVRRMDGKFECANRVTCDKHSGAARP